ncbi:MAG: hypothetical protein RSB65_04065, partial [Oscillospiraceae bacterium]
MTQFKVILERLKKPSVLISIASQIATILLLFKVNVDMTIVTGVITALGSILVLLGILSNPNTQNKGFGDDILPCAGCGKDTVHLMVNGEMVCRECGTVFIA